LHGIGFDVQAFRAQTVHLAALFAVEMGVRPVVFVGRQAVVGGPAAGAQAFDDTLVHQPVQDAVDRDPVDGAAALQALS